jgi:ATP-dependent DNA helicase DinG
MTRSGTMAVAKRSECDTIESCFAADGPLFRVINGYRPREAQIEMAQAVDESIRSGGCVVVEAGTGTGKTFAYLIPALLSQANVIVSTGTRTLQDQLFQRDLPLLMRALRCSGTIALLKGRANYLCRYRLEQAVGEGRFVDRSLVDELQQVVAWSGRTASGDIADSGLSEESRIWPLVTSTSDNCLGQECDEIDECFLAKARKAAMDAQLVVVNHHLLLADFALRDRGFGELLPACDAVIIDEAHQLPDIASSFFGQSISSRQLIELSRDIVAEQQRDAVESVELALAADRLEGLIGAMRLAFGVDPARESWPSPPPASLLAAIADLEEQLTLLIGPLEALAERGRGLASCLERATAQLDALKLLNMPPTSDEVQWFETFRSGGFIIHRTPLDIAEPFSQCLAQVESWVFTSATLAVAERFDHFNHTLGLTTTVEMRLPSPFDFRQQALLYCPTGMVEPRDPNYTAMVVEKALPVVEASGGSAFLLFTSYRAMHEAEQLLTATIDYPLLVQGRAPRARLLEQFRELGNAVLLGTQSFWEGVDVRGEALTCVVIDRLPFASPGDPVLQARIDAMRRNGGNPFMEFQVPSAVITLKQGVGRLIRDMDDYGALVLCDPRLISRPYGQTFLASLPAMPKTRKIEVVERFYQRFRR